MAIAFMDLVLARLCFFVGRLHFLLFVLYKQSKNVQGQCDIRNWFVAITAFSTNNLKKEGNIRGGGQHMCSAAFTKARGLAGNKCYKGEMSYNTEMVLTSS